MSRAQSSKTQPEESTTPEFIFRQAYRASRALVAAAWTDPEQMARWWGPHGFTNQVCELDARPGGHLRIDMRGPDGTVYPMVGAYEVVEPDRVVFTCVPLDEHGQPLFEVLNTVTLDERAGTTTQTVRARVRRVSPGAPIYLAGMEAGWSQSLERLADHLAQGSRGGAVVPVPS
jgi:uncharacterized protein YndB with AHSA1/START domain